VAPLSGHNLSPALAAWVLLAVHGIGWLLGCAERRTEITVVTADSSGVDIQTIHGSPELLSTLGLGEVAPRMAWERPAPRSRARVTAPCRRQAGR